MSGAGGARLALAGSMLAIAAALAWLCLRTVISGAYAETDPARALRWDPANPQALTALAVATANAGDSDAAFDRAARLARRALTLAPLDSSALRVLALDAERHGQEARAAALMGEVSRRTRRDSLAQAWMMNRAFEGRRYAQGFEYAAAIMQRAPEWGETIFPAMTATFGDPASRPALRATLATGPEWRRMFLAELVAEAPDVAALRGFFESFRTAQVPLTDQEAGLLIGRLIAEGRYGAAQEAWRVLSGQAARSDRLVYDGDFRGAPGAPPFNWGLASDASAVAERVQAPDGEPALYVRFPLSEPSPLAEELLVLAPGEYVLSGRVLFGERRAERLNWRIQCADGEAIELPAATETPQGGGWSAFEIPFTVPAQNCPGQWLQLGSQAQDDFGMAEAWFAAIDVRPQG